MGRQSLTAACYRLPTSPFAKTLPSVAGARVFSIALGPATLGYAARPLGPELYGMCGVAAAAVAYVSIVLSPGLTTWGTRTIPLRRDFQRRMT